MFSEALIQTTPAGGPSGGFIQYFGLMAVIFAIFYFLMIRPARTKQKRHQEMVGRLKNGDKVVTAGGIYGTVVGVSDDRITLRISKEVKVEFQKSSIAEVEGGGS